MLKCLLSIVYVYCGVLQGGLRTGSEAGSENGKLLIYSILSLIVMRQGSGPHRSSGGAGGVKWSRMPRWGCHRQVTGGGQTGFPEEIPLTSV